MKHRKPTPAWQKLGLRVSKKLAVGATALATVFGGLAVASVSAQASTDRNSYADTVGNPTFEAARKKYGLTKEMKNGAILHAWMWSFNTITEHMDEIAEAGYTSIQTEPMSKIKVNDANGKKFTENWYYVYQPTNTSIGNFVVGSEDDLKAMTVAAHAHGIRIIVDVVANHFTADWNAIDSDWQKSEYFHARNSCSGSGGDNIDYSNRWQVTHCHLLGLWDLNTANPEVANRMHDFLKTAVNDGVDGFRFDAGKHVELPNEFDGSQYWTTILQNGSQYQYGEVLQGDSGLDYKAYANLYAKYGEGGGGATASDYGKTIRSALWSKNLNAGNLMSLRNGGVNDDQLVTWVESHDNYANSDKESTYLTNDQIRFGWAVVGARAGGAPLFFNRPKASGGNQPQFAEASQLGDAGDDMWKDTAVAAVNHFRNAMDGEAEYLRNCGSEQNNNSCLMVERYKTDNNAGNDGVSIANMGGDQNLAGTPTKLDDGTYTDQVNGGTITVSNGKITSGTAKGDAVSVYFNTSVKESVSATVSKKFSSNTIKVTLNASNATNLTYSLSNGKNGSFVDGDSLTIGGDMEIGDSVTLTVKGTGAESGEALEFTATYTKVEVQANTIYATKPSGWSKMYAYVYTGDGATAKNNATGHRQHVLQEQRINGDHAINRNAILAIPHGAHNLAGARKIRREIHVANILAKLVGKQQTFLGGQIHNRLIGILNFRIGNERLQAHVTTLHRDQAERSRKTARRACLRIRLRKDQIIARSIIRMAFRAQHAGQHLHDGIQGMHHAVKFFAIRFRGFQGIRDLRDMRGFHGFHFPRGLVDRIVRDLERLLRRFQSGNFDRAVFHVNTVQINIFGDFHQLRQRLRRNILHGGHRGAYGGNVIAHIRHDRGHLPQRRRGLLVGLAYVIGERGCLLLKLGRVRFGDGLLQALST